MERCPNCGAPTRPGAKFCTTCGYRLIDEPGDPLAASADEGTLTAAATSAGTAWSTSADEAAAEEAAPPSDVALTSDAAAEDGPIPPATDGALPPPAFAETSSAGDGGEPRSADGSAAAVADDEPEAADHVLSSSWPTPDAAPWLVEWGTPREGSTQATTPDEAPTADAEPVQGDDPPLPWTGGAWGSQPEPPADPAALGPDSGATLPPAASLGDAPGVDAPDEPIGAIAADHSVHDVEEHDAAPATDADDDPATRAAALVEELRALLPVLTAAPDLDADAVAADLGAALPTDRAAATNDRDLLRAALRAVRDRPRDIDAMLDLAVRADPLLALIDAHDAALAAIDRAIDALRPDPS